MHSYILRTTTTTTYTHTHVFPRIIDNMKVSSQPREHVKVQLNKAV